MSDIPANQLFDAYFMAAPMRAVFSDRGRLQGMLDFEAALARAEARTGVVPATAVAPIEAACRAELYDPLALAEAVATAGNSAIPLVKALGRQVAAGDAEAERYVHLGATSQDAMDSGLVLQLRRALALLEQDLQRLAEVLADQAERHADTPLAGRTWLQHATPVTLGMKLAGLLGALTRHRQRLRELRPRLLVLQFGGASGTLAALGEQALPVAAALAEELGLALPEQPWHTQRDRLVEFASVLGLVAGSLGKFGRDVSLLMQTEAGEVFEPAGAGRGGSSTMAHKRNPRSRAGLRAPATPAPGGGRRSAPRCSAGGGCAALGRTGRARRGGSSTMPHKRNPVSSAVLIAAATRAPGLVSTLFAAMPQEHERSLGLWHAEWETLPELCCLVAGALQQAIGLLEGLEVDAQRMRRNLGLTHGLVLAEAVSIALARRIGREAAHHLVEQCCRRAVEQRRELRAVLGEEARVSAELSGDELDRLLDPAHYLGQARAWVERALAEHHALGFEPHPA
ncbi:3-carboxy-cis,cis-muconate cycloisomerase [Pseudomonas aeruginosa]